MQQLQVAIANMPINLVLLTNGNLAFVRVNNFKALFDMAPVPDGVGAEFYEELFVVGGTEYLYNTVYNPKEIPAMSKWIKQQNL